MNYIIDNYVMFIAITIFLLMVVIGFVAEKTEFGRKPKKEKEAEKPVVIEPVKEEMVNVDTALETPVVAEPTVEETVIEPFAEPVMEEVTTLPVIEEAVVSEPLEAVAISELPVTEEKPSEEIIAPLPEIGEVVNEEEKTEETDVWRF